MDSARPILRSSHGVPPRISLRKEDVHGQKARAKRIPSHERRVPAFLDGAGGPSSLAPSREGAGGTRSEGAQAAARLTAFPSRLPRWRPRHFVSPVDGFQTGGRGAKRASQDTTPPPNGRRSGESGSTGSAPGASSPRSLTIDGPSRGAAGDRSSAPT